MAEFHDDPDRQVVPRWRSFASAANFGEVTSLKVRTPDLLGPEVLQSVLEDWRREPGLSVAADVVSVAFSIGQMDEARDAANYLLGQDATPVAARHIALRCLGRIGAGPSSEFVEFYSQPQFDQLHKAVHAARARLSEYSINPILWTNLGLLYITLGQYEKAKRAVRVALNLAPDNRFVVRAACRLFLHGGDIEQAHSVLLRTPAVQVDPWILAGELAISSIRGRTSHFAKKARRMVESESHSAFHLSELTGTLATMEATSGNRRKAKKLTALSLADPAENAIAQAAWLSRRLGESVGTPPATSSIHSSEASAWSASVTGNWKIAVNEARLWHAEQPFSSRPANFGAYIASMALEDFSLAEQMLRQSLASNRDDAVLFNNLAFALVQQGNVEEAATCVDKGRKQDAAPRNKICLTATSGLIAFRSGNAQKGRMLYKVAASLAAAHSLSDLSCIAQAYHAIEEIRCGSAEAVACKKNALEAVKKLSDPLRRLFTEKISNARFAIDKSATATKKR